MTFCNIVLLKSEAMKKILFNYSPYKWHISNISIKKKKSHLTKAILGFSSFCSLERMYVFWGINLRTSIEFSSGQKSNIHNVPLPGCTSPAVPVTWLPVLHCYCREQKRLGQVHQSWRSSSILPGLLLVAVGLPETHQAMYLTSRSTRLPQNGLFLFSCSILVAKMSSSCFHTRYITFRLILFHCISKLSCLSKASCTNNTEGKTEEKWH